MLRYWRWCVRLIRRVWIGYYCHGGIGLCVGDRDKADLNAWFGIDFGGANITN